MEYDWIEIDRIPTLSSDHQLILFGAGEGSRQVLNYFKKSDTRPQTIAVADNDSSMWGRDFEGIDIISPADITTLMQKHLNCRVMVTTISGQESVGKQLTAMGFDEDQHYFQIGCYPSLMSNFEALLDLNGRHQFITEELRVLHVGPGGFLGLECGLSALGCRVTSIDAFGFSMHYPNIADVHHQYNQARAVFLKTAGSLGRDNKELHAAWDALVIKNGDDYHLDADRIDYRYPFRFSDLPVEDQSIDLLVSFAVLEHVHKPDKVIQEIKRVLSPGGICCHHIITWDHRSFSIVDGYTPLSYAQYSHQQWEEINADKFYQNRVLPFQWEDKFKTQGFEMLEHTVLDNYQIPAAEYETMYESFKQIPRRQLEKINCRQVVRKPAAK
jgi:SAM-dependent methyltransferase